MHIVLAIDFRPYTHHVTVGAVVAAACMAPGPRCLGACTDSHGGVPQKPTGPLQNALT